MTQSTANGTTAQYKCDAMRRRVARITPSGTDTFFYGMGGRLLATYRWSNPSTPELTVYMAGQKLGQYTDRIGSVRYANTGGVVSHYYPYGELVAGASNTGFKFAETYRDDSEGVLAGFQAPGSFRPEPGRLLQSGHSRTVAKLGPLPALTRLIPAQ